MVPPWIVLRTREEGVQSRWSPENRNALPVISRDYIVVVNDAIGMKVAVSFSRLVQWRSYVHTAKFHRITNKFELRDSVLRVAG